MPLSKVAKELHTDQTDTDLYEDNILFNLPFDEERYQKTLRACALESDLLILEDGDESEIGERGVRPLLPLNETTSDRPFCR